MTAKAEFIYQPTSGQYSEKHFETSKQEFKSQSWSWVLFNKLNGKQWTASFRGGDAEKKLLAILGDTSIVFVVADGQGYFVNVDAEELIKYTKQETIKEVASNEDNSLILFADNWNIFTVDKTLEEKKLDTPFEFYFVWFKQLTGDILKVEYEEMYTGDFITTYLDTKSLKFTTTEKQSG